MDLLYNQLSAFAVTLLIGLFAGFCYDYYLVLREVYRFGKVGTFLGDIVFWLVTAVLVFFLLLLGNMGDVRLYVFIGLGLGALLYFQLFSKAAHRLVRMKFHLLRQVWLLFVRIIRFFWRIITYPFRLILLILFYPWNLIKKLAWHIAGKHIQRAVRKIKVKIKQLVDLLKKKKKE